MNVPLYIARRYLMAKRKQVFISVISGFSVLGVALGVTALVVVISVMAGFEEDLRTKILGTNSHIVVLKRGGSGAERSKEVEQAMRNVPGVSGLAPFVFSQAMARSVGNLMGVVVKGIDPTSFSEVTDVGKRIVEGSLGSLATVPKDGPPPMVVGKELSRNLAVFVGENLDVISPLGEVTPMGMIPRFRTYQVQGVFQTGMYEYDSSFVYIPLKEAQEFFNMGDKITGYEVKVDDIYRAREIALLIESSLGPEFYTRHWMEMNQNLFSALKLEKTVMFLILLMIIIVASFGIIATLIMMVMEKGKDIAILKAMGAPSGMVRRIFIWQGLLIGVSGTLLGLGGGYGLCLLLKRYEFIHLPADVYYISTLPVKIQPAVFALVSVAALLTCLLATLYPSRSAARLDPIEALRYE
ncbi:MAG: lipoprotein-releasing ABC transporter permease subunit [Nitrospirae bacterium]|nr:lipoprotein-releasing ABC transporter permease subunit [Nitrospirota bacterium]